jgi:hypothetical protein
MVFGAITGKTGTGKTLFLTKKLFERYKMGHRVFANYILKFPPMPNTVPPVFISTLEELELIKGDAQRPAVAGFDELWVWLDSRDWKKAKNAQVTKTVFFSRKRYVDVFYTTQNFHMVELRIREQTDADIRPDLNMIKRIPFQGRMQNVPLKCTAYYYSVSPKGDGRKYEMSKKPIRSQKFFTLPFMNMYDTREEIQKL